MGISEKWLLASSEMNPASVKDNIFMRVQFEPQLLKNSNIFIHYQLTDF